ncbi:YbgC/FadM family acyl-CoA thioesterase [Geopsychrobacter electrodiphilus]|uniref:YbgC/FadM family acyl-CoA thioesterase n=1 Tax=Geopsychrobacter electrodiphilus TaxID=225196 RepID=UPI0003623488
MKISTEIEVRFADLDAYGHVNNAIFFTYLETARVKLFRQRFAEQMKNGLLFLVVEASCRYRLPIELNDRVLIDIETEALGRSSFTFSYLIHNGDGKEFATARTVMVCYDAKKAKTISLPVDFRAALEG